MGRYIDAEKIKITADTMIADGECYVPLLAVKQAIARTPTEDVVEVVRCKDCKYFNGKIDVLCERCGDIDEPCGGCHYTGCCTYDDGYCYHGERRKEDAVY